MAQGFLQDEAGNKSVSRLAPFVALTIVIGQAVFQLKAGLPIVIDPSVLNFLGLCGFGYLGAKGMSLAIPAFNIGPVKVEGKAGLEEEAATPAEVK